jgi:alkylation response protein AidB-like acyl-CoA dehydrogenase
MVVAGEAEELTEELIRSTLARCCPKRDPDARLSILGAGGFDLDAGRRYLGATVDLGLAVPTWPTQYGGRDATRDEAALISKVKREFAIPDIYPFGVGVQMVGLTVLELGTEEQKHRWVRRIASGDDVWCQLFSEPDAGSDLANAGTMAVGVDGGWKLTGQKVWTSRAIYSNWGICLARTSPEKPKHKGLTMFAVSMSAPGVDVRPLRQMNGDDHFSEVFLSDVFVADTDRIGDVDAGWSVALAILAHERAGGQRGGTTAPSRKVPAWLAELTDAGLVDNAVKRDQAMRLYCEDRVIRLNQQRASANARAGRRPGAEGSGQKVRASRSFQRRAYFADTLQGAAGMLTDWPGFIDLMTAPSMSIRGGSDEIQLNIMSERVLGLPADVRTDKDTPWTLSRKGISAPTRNDGASG